MDKAGKGSSKYNSLDEVISAIKTEWAGSDSPEDTEENRVIVPDGLYWCGVELARYNYPRSQLFGLVKLFQKIRKRWEVAGNERDC